MEETLTGEQTKGILVILLNVDILQIHVRVPSELHPMRTLQQVIDIADLNDTLMFSAPKTQSTIDDYDPYSQKGLFDNFDIQRQFFCAKGHLTPNADFTNDDQRSLTMITTNIAPQWH